jgi:hypothetical protein
MSVFKKRKWILWLSVFVFIVAVPITIFMQIIIHSNVPELAEGSIEQRYAQKGSYHVKVDGASSEMMHNTNWMDVIQANMDDNNW